MPEVYEPSPCPEGQWLHGWRYVGCCGSAQRLPDCRDYPPVESTPPVPPAITRLRLVYVAHAPGGDLEFEGADWEEVTQRAQAAGARTGEMRRIVERLDGEAWVVTQTGVDPLRF